MEQVDANQIDQIVVYKIDRLTRSLADFAKLVDRLDDAGASFVSVTQSCNTSTSMGRLTLNVLLSFAQFEREFTAERIRDKIAASKRKGLWMGGNVPLGYDPDGRTLAINKTEAQTVRSIYDLYEHHGTLRLVRDRAEQLQLRSKVCKLANGSSRGGHFMSRGQLHHMLISPIYAGRIRHKGQVFEGQHPAIIDPARWDRIQERLVGKSAKKRKTKQHHDPSPLAGKLFDEAGEKLTPSHTKKGNQRYRYYISNKLVTGVSRASERQQTWRIPAAQLEGPIASPVRARLLEWQNERDVQLTSAASAAPIEKSAAFELIERVEIKPGKLLLTLNLERARMLISRGRDLGDGDLQITLPFAERRRRVEIKLIVGDTATPDGKPLRNLANANPWYARLKDGATFEQVALEAGASKRRVQQMIHLSFLASDIVRQITQGTQPLGLTSNWLLRHDMPAAWDAQRKRTANL
jgi:hypothetical protein